MTADASSRLDRYIAGELPRDEEQSLAQAALNDQDLFDALMAESAARTAIRLEGSRERAGAGPVPVLRTRSGAAWLAAAAAVTLAILYPVLGGNDREDGPAVQAVAARPAAAPKPAAMPVILTARLEDLTGRSSAEFRSASGASRSPNAEGEITSAGDGEAVVALGALDGVVQYAELAVYRGGARNAPVARLRIETVFRETSRAHVIGPAVRAGDVALVPPTLVVAAARQRMISLIAAADVPGARAAAEHALPQFKDAGVHADDKRTVLTLLGALERRAAETDRAIDHLGAAVALLATAPLPSANERTETLTEFGAALLETRRIDEAERALRDARQTASGVGAVHVLNDLGVAAALRGDRAGASNLYRAALDAAGSAQATANERRAIARNLTDLAAAR